MQKPRPINPNFSQLRLADATVQELQLELLRRSVADQYSVDELIQILIDNQNLWRGLIIDRLGINEGGHWLQPMSMIKLRNIEDNYWNADTLFVLCPNKAAAESLKLKIPGEKFAAMIDVKDDAKEIDNALGGADRGLVILRAWWD